MSPNRIIELSTLISSNTAILDSYFQSHELPSPSFDVNVAPVQIPIPDPGVEDARIAVLEAATELKDLLDGLGALVNPGHNMTALHAIYRLDIASKIPLKSTISYTELAAACDIPEFDLKRILRYAMSYHHVFIEPQKGFVSHTQASKLLAESQEARDGMGMANEELWPAYSKTVDALLQFKSQEPNQTGFSLANNTRDSFYEFVDKNPSRAKRFAGAMASWNKASSPDVTFLQRQYSWTTAATQSKLVVDIGGSTGHIAIALATAHPYLNLIVQDMPAVIQGAEERLPADLPSEVKARIQFKAQSFFTEQSVKDADIYIFRQIFHNWPDAYCLKILHNLIPALKKGARVLVNDFIMPEAGTLGIMREKTIRAMDMTMLSMFNAREREEGDWITLFRDADARFKFLALRNMPGSDFGILEFEWEG